VNLKKLAALGLRGEEASIQLQPENRVSRKSESVENSCAKFGVKHGIIEDAALPYKRIKSTI